MVALDSLYAMLARPVQRVVTRKRVVDQTEHIDAIHADSHEAPQSQLRPIWNVVARLTGASTPDPDATIAAARRDAYRPRNRPKKRQKKKR